MYWLTHYRLLSGLAALVIAGMMGFAFYLEYVNGLEPCPLCMAQRVAFVGLGLVFLVAALWAPVSRAGRWIMTSGLLVFSAAGAALAGRQLYLQSLTAEQAEALTCGMGLEFMLDAFPFWEVVRLTLRGTGDCAEVQWVFLGLSIPGWTFVAFLGFAALALWLALMKRSNADGA